MFQKIQRRCSALAVVLALMTATTLGALVLLPPEAVSAAQEADEEVPPGNPVIGDDRPGDIEPEDDTNYALWAVLAICLIGAGTLLIKVERWEARRIAE